MRLGELVFDEGRTLTASALYAEAQLTDKNGNLLKVRVDAIQQQGANAGGLLGCKPRW